ncbi:DUF4397 domain-containing protein [Halosegnis sp.]|uniref:DUF4397 domain-containing protein n=1 Tax=Halosegnis sp. TaxID=2864959 RepID=UPI0035D4D53B
MREYDRRTLLQGIGTVGIASVVGIGTVTADDGDEAGGDAKLRVAHAVPDAPTVDVLVDGSVVVSGAEFRDVTGYLELAAGEYDVAINAAGTDNTVASATVELDAEDYTAAATGNLNPEGNEAAIGLDLFEDKLGVIDDGRGRVRAYHLSPDAPAVDVAVADDNDEPAVFLAEGIEFGEAGPNVDVGASTYPVAVYPAGSSDPVFGPVDVTVKEGQVLSALAEWELSPEDGDGDDAAFAPVLAYEEAAPFAGGRGDNEDEEDEEDEENDE